MEREKGKYPDGEERDRLYDEACVGLGVTDPITQPTKKRVDATRRCARIGRTKFKLGSEQARKPWEAHNFGDV